MSTEDRLKAFMVQHLQDDFLIYAECEGRDEYGHGVRIDFLAYPKPHLTDFDQMYFGIEVKYHDVWTTTPTTEVWAQALTYTQCEFITPQGMKRLPYVLVFTNLQLPKSPRRPHKPENWGALTQFLGRFHVGELEFLQYQDEPMRWRISFATSGYYYEQGRGRSRSNAGIALYAGNVLSKRGLITDYIKSKYYSED